LVRESPSPAEPEPLPQLPRELIGEGLHHQSLQVCWLLLEPRGACGALPRLEHFREHLSELAKLQLHHHLGLQLDQRRELREPLQQFPAFVPLPLTPTLPLVQDM
jgi:hypothetical protein